MLVPTVVVVGLLGSQQQQLERACAGVARLRFVNSRVERAHFPRGDHVVLLVKWVRHLWTREAFKRFARDRVHYHLGGVSGLAEKIAAIARGVTPPAPHRAGKKGAGS